MVITAGTTMAMSIFSVLDFYPSSSSSCFISLLLIGDGNKPCAVSWWKLSIDQLQRAIQF